jgi:3-phenylpropionate/trans-cinnamate dioxygenase ferredoxin reductase subunit
MQKGARLVIIGGGYIGLEVAAVASSLGLQVTVVESSERVMSRVVSQHTSDFFAAKHRQHGVRLVLGATLSRFSGNDRVRMVELADRSTIPADLVLVCIGVQPNTELAERAGLEVSNGIAVDLQCRTGVEGVFAVGDCTNHPNPILGRRLRLESVHNALEQAKTAASTICGLPAEYAQVPWFWSDQYELKLQIAGISEGHDRTVLRGNPEDVSHACLYLRDGQLIAVDAINAPKDFMQSKALIADHATVSPDTLDNPDIALKDMI